MQRTCICQCFFVTLHANLCSWQLTVGSWQLTVDNLQLTIYSLQLISDIKKYIIWDL